MKYTSLRYFISLPIYSFVDKVHIQNEFFTTKLRDVPPEVNITHKLCKLTESSAYEVS